jgi:parvulin-like peptidyl-prolyl isomerase
MNNAIRLSPGDSTKLANLGIIYHSNDGQDQALVFYKKALNLNPGLAWVYNKMAYIYYLRRDYGKAAKSALLGRELGDPDQPLLDALQLSVGKEMPETADVKQTEEHLRQIVVPSVQQAEEIQGLLNTGSDFSQLAAQNSLPQYSLNGGYVGPLKVQDPAGEIMENVRELPMFATSRVFKTAQGFHLYQKFPVAPELLTFEGN